MNTLWHPHVAEQVALSRAEWIEGINIHRPQDLDRGLFLFLCSIGKEPTQLIIVSFNGPVCEMSSSPEIMCWVFLASHSYSLCLTSTFAQYGSATYIYKHVESYIIESLVPGVEIEPPPTGNTLKMPILQLLGVFTLSLLLMAEDLSHVCIIHNILLKEETHGVAHPLVLSSFVLLLSCNPNSVRLTVILQAGFCRNYSCFYSYCY